MNVPPPAMLTCLIVDDSAGFLVSKTDLSGDAIRTLLAQTDSGG